jgi:hypothetical protein
LEVLHDEIGLTDISLWTEAIRVQLMAIDRVIELVQLRSRLNLHFIQLWLGLFLKN